MSSLPAALTAAPPTVSPASTHRHVSEPCLHCDPPLTPVGFFHGRRPVLFALAGLFVALATAASINGGALLLNWDKPIQHYVEDNRSGLSTEIFERFSFLGSTKVVLALGVVMAIAAWRRCRVVGAVVLAAMLARPLLEFMLKAGVDRDRPDLERLVAGNGPSFPSGHVMAAVALWGLLPLVVTLYTRRRSVWWASLAASVVLILGIGASRTYLGVHWFSDVMGGLLVGVFFLIGVERLLDRMHARRGCTHGCHGQEDELELAEDEHGESVLVGS